MTIKRILILLDDTERSDTRLDAAISLARGHGAALTGLHVISHSLFEPRGGDTAEKALACRELFDLRTRQAGLESDWIDADTGVVGVGPSEIAVHYAYFHDLVIVGQPEPESSDSRSATELPERVVIGSGRPVLIIPYAGVYSTIGQQVMIAWKAGRECTRTVADALPILARAGDVRIMEVNQVNSSDYDRINLDRYLKSHGITAETEQIATGTVTLGDAILNRASTEGADLLIMGACEHGLLGVAGFGEVARHIMKYMTLPVLLSH